ncbi:hypothetical protein [Pseudomonas sp. FG-3G]|nr:hypothetical protein [Pseudomonas sp. FG-3G]
MLANMARRPPLMQADAALSRAGSLPQEIGGGHKSGDHRNSVWERACSR